MVNLESQNLMQLSDFSVLNDIFHPSPAPSVDPRLVLTSRSPSWVPPSQLSPSKKEPTSSPAPVPLSVQELERADSRGPPPPSSPLRDEKSPPVDIVHLAAEEIRKPLLKLKDEPVKGRVPWNLAGLVTHLPGESIPPYPGYHSPHPHTGYSPHLGLPSDLSHSYTNFGTTMGSLTAPTPTTHTTASPSSSTAAGAPGPAYKMEPGDPGAVYYPGAGPAVGGDTPGDHQASAAFQPSHPIPGVSGPELGATDFMQTLQTYIGQPVDMQHPDTEGTWIGDHGGIHPGLFPPQEFEYGRGYTDRKKKIIREWNKTNPSPRASETLTSDPLRQSASYLSGHELFQHPPTLTYNPYGVKDEPLRTDYPYYGYPELVNPYVHMTHRREKRKKQDSLPGGQTLTRDERKAQQLGLPITCADIINLPMDEFNDLLSKHELTEEQLTLCRDIRRRGKNKVAAQNCRKRKIDQIKQLETEVTRIKCRKTELVTDHEKLMSQRSHWSDLVKRLHDFVLKELGHDPQVWQLQMHLNGQVQIMRRNVPPSHLGEPHHQQPLAGGDHHHDQVKGSRYDMSVHGGVQHIQHPAGQPAIQTLQQNSS